MGIYDREYYRREGPSYLDALVPSGRVCRWLIGINIAIFIAQVITFPGGFEGFSFGPVTDALELNTADVQSGQVWRLLSYSFLHSPLSVWHILFNMLFLWMFGGELERMYGSGEFLTFYLIAAVAGGVAFQAQAMVQGSPLHCLGASGAVTAVMVVYAFHFPNTPILLFFLLPIPIWLFVVFQVAQDSLQLFGQFQSSTAVAVHLAGAAFGALYYLGEWRLTGWFQGASRWRRNRSQPRLKLYRPEDEKEPVSVGVKASPDLDEHLDAKLDAVLEKLSKHGRDSLTEGEREILLKASEIYKKKRS
ncbi:MAG: rhomboid family intramembrane serine protease [Gemmataceae bacterium]|nr:rhomboid family intramembrane serine protease [Gemmataceae bacterium]MCI0740350.1 rhomboid family intramembrane serine protease [Gemmataceae bacterium]